jgi:AraC-like DNA-binding protein
LIAKKLSTLENSFFEILVYGGIAQGLFVVLLLNHKTVRKSRANLFLSILILSLTFTIAHIRYAGRVLYHVAAQVYSLGDPTFLLIAPLLWFYVVELAGERVQFNLKLLAHFIPFLLIVLFSLTFHSVESPMFAEYITTHHRLINVFFWILVVVQFSVYLYVINNRWLAYQKRMQQEVSNTENANIAWVRFFIGVFLGVNLFFLFSLFAAIHIYSSRRWMNDAIAGLLSLSVFALSFKGILQRDIFNLLDTPPVPPQPLAAAKPDAQLIATVTIYMQEKKPYLDAELTLSVLAKNLNMSRSQLSQLINDGMGENFYDFVNKYRVEEVKRLMTDPAVKNFNLFGIALEAGFKSKSTFNLIFKRFTGLTPTEYRKNISG